MTLPEKPDSKKNTSRFFTWLDLRTGIGKLLHEALDEPIPGGARFAYVFGSLLLFLFLSQIVTGVVLTLYYIPSADHAHTTVSYIIKEVTGGSFLHSLHAYGSSAIIIVLGLHIVQTFIYGSYKGRRELLWISGCVLLVLMLGMAFTGYLLPWDQKAYFATTVGTNLASEIPWMGSGLKRLLRGGTDMGTLTLSRFFVTHVFLIPGAILGFIALHVYLFRKAGAAGPPHEDPVHPRLPTERFYPRQVVMDLTITLVLIVGLGLLSYWVPIELGPKANPADTQYLPRPEWYYLPSFQWLKYWPGSSAIFGILIIPLIIGIVFVALPFIDRRLERKPWRRPIAMTSLAVGILSIVGLGLLSKIEDQHDPSIAKQIAKQNKETEKFMHTPFEPEFVGGLTPTANVALINPLLVAGKRIYENESCNTCHGEGGLGTTEGAKLIGIGTKISADQIEKLLRHPTPKMSDGGMSAVDLNEEELKALIAYLQSLK